MSTLKADTIQSTGGGAATLTKQSAAKAWVKFDGTGTLAVKSSFNVSGVTDDGTGINTISFTNSMSGANDYTVASIDYRDSSSGGNRSIQGTYSMLAGSYAVSNVYDASVFDDGRLMMHIHGDLA